MVIRRGPCGGGRANQLRKKICQPLQRQEALRQKAARL
jgi:hypothetical protein